MVGQGLSDLVLGRWVGWAAWCWGWWLVRRD